MLLAAGGDALQSLVVYPDAVSIGETLTWYGENQEYGLLGVGSNTLMTLSEKTTPGSIIR